MKEKQIDIFDLLESAWKLKFIFIVIFIFIMALGHLYSTSKKTTDHNVIIKLYPANYESMNSFSLLKRELESFHVRLVQNIFFSNYKSDGSFNSSEIFTQYINNLRKFIDFDLSTGIQKLDNGIYNISFVDSSKDNANVINLRYLDKINEANYEFNSNIVKMVKQSLELHSENLQRRLDIEKRLMDSDRIETIYAEEIEATSNLTGGFFNEIANDFSLSTDLTIKASELAKYIEQRVNTRIKKMEDLTDIAEEVNELLKLEDLPNNLDYKIYDYSLHVENVPSRSGYYYFVSFILSIMVISLILILKISYEFRDKESPS
tara:strand:+ start:301 stop:1257 length:957 start_codon:yes stop_codon:yes gene_type:complete